MFDIKIGTIISARQIIKNLDTLNPIGYESYELTVDKGYDEAKLKELSEKLPEKLEGRVISALASYENPLQNEADMEHLKCLIRSAKYFNCNAIGFFGGWLPNLSVNEMIPEFKKKYTDTVKLAEDEGVRLGFENCSCGGTWWKNRNIAFSPAAWELLFDAIDSPSLGLEWEPCHMIHLFVDPVANLRKFAKKVVHVHGKDATVAWDIIREYGIDSDRSVAWDRTPGFGDSNWADFFTILIQNGFEGACDIEGYHDPVHYDDMEWTAQKTAVDYLKRCRGGIEFIPGPEEIKGFQGRRK